MEKLHYFENWIYYKLGPSSDLIVFFNLEFVDWLKEVYFNKQGFYLDREINFLEKQILDMESELNISHFEKVYPYLNVKELEGYFNKSNSSILKAIEYGFGPHLAAYVRSACIYETVYKENIEGRTEILAKISEVIAIVNKIKYEQGQLVKNPMISKGDIKMIEDNNNILHNEIKNLIKTVENTLKITHIKEVKQKLDSK